MKTSDAGPGRTGYVIALIVFVVGLIGSAALVAVFVFGLIGLGENLERFTAPGVERLELTETGTYTIFYEYKSSVDGVDYSTSQSEPDLTIFVERVDDGEEISVNNVWGTTTYDWRGYAGESIRRFEANEPGTYELTVEYADGSQEPEIVLAIGEGIGRDILTSAGAFIGGGLIFCLFTLVAIGIAGITLLRRNRVEPEPTAPGSNPPR